MPIIAVATRIASTMPQSARVIRLRVFQTQSISMVIPMNNSNPAAIKVGTAATIWLAKKKPSITVRQNPSPTYCGLAPNWLATAVEPAVM